MLIGIFISNHMFSSHVFLYKKKNEIIQMHIPTESEESEQIHFYDLLWSEAFFFFAVCSFGDLHSRILTSIQSHPAILGTKASMNFPKYKISK